MAHDRLQPCIHYICLGKCEKGRNAIHNGYCQKCGLYKPRARVKARNKKKEFKEKLRVMDD